MNENVAQHFVILYYFRDGSYWWSCCETRPIFNLVDTRCNRIVTAWRPFGTFHQQRFCYSVSVAWDHPLQSASLEIIGLSLCHQIYPLDPLPFYPFLSFSFGLLVCSVPHSRAGAESLCPWCWHRALGRLTATNNCFTNQECLHFEMCWQIQLPSTWYPQYPLSAALLGCNIKCPLMRPFSWQGPASFLSSEHNAAPSFGWRK